MTRRTTFEDLALQLARINQAASLCHLKPFMLDSGPGGKWRLVDSKGRGVLGASTGLGMASIPKRELLQRMEDFLLGLETAYLALRS